MAVLNSYFIFWYSQRSSMYFRYLWYPGWRVNVIISRFTGQELKEVLFIWKAHTWKFISIFKAVSKTLPPVVIPVFLTAFLFWPPLRGTYLVRRVHGWTEQSKHAMFNQFFLFSCIPHMVWCYLGKPFIFKSLRFHTVYPLHPLS